MAFSLSIEYFHIYVKYFSKQSYARVNCCCTFNRLMAFKQMRKEFDRKYGNDDNGGIKREIEEELFK